VLQRWIKALDDDTAARSADAKDAASNSTQYEIAGFDGFYDIANLAYVHATEWLRISNTVARGMDDCVYFSRVFRYVNYNKRKAHKQKGGLYV